MLPAQATEIGRSGVSCEAGAAAYNLAMNVLISPVEHSENAQVLR